MKTYGGWAAVALVMALTGAVSGRVGWAATAGFDAALRESAYPEDTVMVIVAAHELEPGSVIEAEDLYAVQIPPRFLPPGVFLSPEHVVGRTPASPIYANELVRAERLR